MVSPSVNLSKCTSLHLVFPPSYGCADVLILEHDTPETEGVREPILIMQSGLQHYQVFGTN